ncbi:MAG: right-handed parallel beta-helix repeat-containing protein [Myxococcales bacterium]|nr:right-handed parallel beta-helix repeat-containing protein [Myxococcales bacterium]
MARHCIPEGQVAVVGSAAELREALGRARGVRLQPGIYRGTWQVVMHQVVLVGPQALTPSAEPAILSPIQPGPVLRLSSRGHAFLDGIIVRGGMGPSGHGIFCETADSRLALRRSEVSQNEGKGIWARCPAWISQSRIGGWQEAGRNQGGGVLAEDNLVLTNSFIVHNGTAFSLVGGVALRGSPSGNRLLAHLTFVGNLCQTDGIAVHCGDIPVEIWHSLLWNNERMPGRSTIGGRCLLRAAAVDDLDAFHGAGVLLDQNNPPRFRGLFDFHLLPGSPAQDAIPPGAPGPRMEFDYDGDRRPQGAGFDFGADEVTP